MAGAKSKKKNRIEIKESLGNTPELFIGPSKELNLNRNEYVK